MSDLTPISIIPASQDSEAALIASILADNAIYDAVSRMITANEFTSTLFKRCFELITAALEHGKAVNAITIKSDLPEHMILAEGVTIGDFILRLVRSENIMTADHCKALAEVIHEKYNRRECITIGNALIEAAHSLDDDKDIIDEIGEAEEKLLQIRADRLREANSKGIGETYIETLNESFREKLVKGVGICLPEIGDVISEPCFEAGNLYGLLSSSGEGKTSLTLQQIYYALREGHPVLFLSYDQTKDQCMRQIIAQVYGMEARRQRSGDISEKEFAQAMELAQWVDKSRLLEIIECNDEGAAQLAGYVRNFVKRRGNGKVPFVVIDHIGSIKPHDMRADPGTKAKEINKVLKATARQTHAAFLVLNQRNSEGMKRDNPRPISADLFGGDPAKQAYDAIIFLYRPQKYKSDREATAANDKDRAKINQVFAQNVEDVAELGAIKVRFGNAGIRNEVIFEAKYTRYVSPRREHTEPGLL